MKINFIKLFAYVFFISNFSSFFSSLSFSNTVSSSDFDNNQIEKYFGVINNLNRDDWHLANSIILDFWELFKNNLINKKKMEITEEIFKETLSDSHRILNDFKNCEFKKIPFNDMETLSLIIHSWITNNSKYIKQTSEMFIDAVPELLNKIIELENILKKNDNLENLKFSDSLENNDNENNKFKNKEYDVIPYHDETFKSSLINLSLKNQEILSNKNFFNYSKIFHYSFIKKEYNLLMRDEIFIGAAFCDEIFYLKECQIFFFNFNNDIPTFGYFFNSKFLDFFPFFNYFVSLTQNDKRELFYDFLKQFTEHLLKFNLITKDQIFYKTEKDKFIISVIKFCLKHEAKRETYFEEFLRKTSEKK